MPLLNDSGGDLFGNLLPIVGSERQLSFDRIREKTALDQYGRQPAHAQYIVFSRSHSAVLGADTSNKLLLDTGRKHCAAVVFRIRLDTMRATPR